MVADVDVALDMKFDSFAWQAEKRTPQQLLTSQNRSLTPYQGSKRQIYSVWTFVEALKKHAYMILGVLVSTDVPDVTESGCQGTPGQTAAKPVKSAK